MVGPKEVVRLLLTQASPITLTRKVRQQTIFNFFGFVALAPYDISVLAGGKTLDQPNSEKMIDELTNSFSDNAFNFAHFAMNMWGTQAAFPNLQLNDLFN